jgi:SAM-dependent methyltransferase
MSNRDNQPDWDRIAEKFDVFLPQLAPVGEALLEALKAVPGDRVLDVASGTGEPALTLARREPGVIVTGIDAAEGMVRAARKKVAAERLPNITFRTMAAERLDFADESFDKVMCRFGVMLFEDPLAGCREIRRVLKPGGRFAFAVWSSPEMMTTMQWAARAFRGRVPDDRLPPIDLATRFGRPGALDLLLGEAGFSRFDITPHRFDYQYESFEAYWDAMEDSEINRQQFDALPEHERDSVRDEFACIARDFHTDHGLVIPHEYLLAAGER